MVASVNAADTAGQIAIMLGNADGSFGAATLLPTPMLGPDLLIPHPSILVGDFNNDGKQDLVLYDPEVSNENFDFFAGNGDSTFAPAVVSTLPNVSMARRYRWVRVMPR